MDEKAKSKVFIYIIVILVIFIVILIFGGVFLYKELKDGRKEENVIERQDQNNYLENTNHEQQNNTYEYDGNITKNIRLNGNDYKVVLQYKNIEIESTDEDSDGIKTAELFKQSYKLLINDKQITGIDNGAKWIPINEEEQSYDDIYNLERIKDISNDKEYLVLTTYIELVASGPSVKIYIIDVDEGKIIRKFEESNVTTYITKEGLPLENIKIEGDSIKKIKSGEDNIQIVKYTIENGNIKENVEKTYNINDIETAGK